MADKSAILTQILKEQCLRHGFGGIRGLGVVFRTMDLDCSRSLVLDELRIGLEKFGLRMADKYLKTLFDSIDQDKNGKIDFLEFMKALRSPMNNKRIAVINEAFDKLDTNNDGVLDIEDLKVFYTANAKNHPKYLSGEWTLDQTLRSFLDSIDSPDDPDGVVTREEFLDYYAGVSATIDDDSYFVMMMRSCYGLPQR
ncbi:calcyphosin-like protein isoform X3 [Mytilus californianus]|uniref:calcyphosin-like protein isoform X3 n=1 Tax=Mytilus californianus TaxID=6549 RepID=UPI002247927C|nr:calcyphosin-like protein isoform X3 [Mytilus californianus]